MILPIYAYGQPVLKRVAKEVDKDDPELKSLIANMWETMYQASGVGLAAPQVGRSLRLFLVDTIQIMEDNEKDLGIKKVFINAEKVEEEGPEWAYEEGCLSIPEVRGDVMRQPRLKIRYFDEDFQEHTEVFAGINARVIQHEYDHIDGVLFIEHLKPIKKRLIKKKLENIKKGKIGSEYKMKFAKK